MKRDKFNLTTIELDEGETIPNNINQLMECFMGGPMDTWMEKDYPWLINEKRRSRICRTRKTLFRFCLGCLLGEVVGGKVVKSNPKLV